MWGGVEGASAKRLEEPHSKPCMVGRDGKAGGGEEGSGGRRVAEGLVRERGKREDGGGESRRREFQIVDWRGGAGEGVRGRGDEGGV